MNRSILAIALVVVLGVVAGVCYLASDLGSVVARVIESEASAVAGVPVRVGAVELDLANAAGTVLDLRVGNPPGFSEGDAFRLARITVDLDADSLTGSPAVVDELLVAEPDARFEVDGSGLSNFQWIQGHASRYTASEPGATAAGEDDAEDPAESFRLVIRSLVFEEGKVSADVSEVSEQDEPLETVLPSFRVEDIGGTAGATPTEISKRVLTAFTGAVLRAVAANQVQRGIEKGFEEAGKAIGEAVRDIFE